MYSIPNHAERATRILKEPCSTAVVLMNLGANGFDSELVPTVLNNDALKANVMGGLSELLKRLG